MKETCLHEEEDLDQQGEEGQEQEEGQARARGNTYTRARAPSLGSNDSDRSMDDASTTSHEATTSHSQHPQAKLGLSVHWLLWCGIGAAATANTYGIQPVPSLLIGAAFFFTWAVVGVTPAQLLKAGADALVELYFREYIASGAKSVPEGAVIFVCGPHSNQFLDPMVVSKGTDRDIRYIIAAKSLRRKDVGWLFKHSNPVPVERAQDLARKGTGRIRIEDKTVTGEGTKFLKEIPLPRGGKQQEGGKYVIRLTGLPTKSPVMPVKKVISDTELLLLHPPQEDYQGADPASYKIFPPIDHEAMFNAVFDHLGGGGALGIFPEGGSHDQTRLLPLKAGVCIMALGTMKKYPGCDVKLVPVGLNYFSQHKFNSRVLVQFGQPITIERRLRDKFSAGGEEKQRSAVSELLEEVEEELRKVTVTAPDWKTLKIFWALRDLYVPSKRLIEMSMVDKVLLAQALASDYDRVKDDPEVKRIMDRVKRYSRKLDALGLKDKGNLQSAVLVMSNSTIRLLCLLVVRCLYIFCLHVTLTPVYLILAPVYVVATVYSRAKTRQAVAASTVKIKGKDVMGTYKVIIALPLVFVGHIVLSGLIWIRSGEVSGVGYFFFAPLIQYVVYKMIPEDIALIRSTYSLAVNVLFQKDQTEIWKERRSLKEDVRELVDRLGWGYDHASIQEMKMLRKTETFDSGHFYRSVRSMMDSFAIEEVEKDLFFKHD